MSRLECRNQLRPKFGAQTIDITLTVQMHKSLRFILIPQHYVLPSAKGDLCLAYLHLGLTRCLSAPQIPLAARLPSTQTVTRQLSLSVTTALSLSLHYPFRSRLVPEQGEAEDH